MTQLLIDRTTLEQLVVAQPCQGLSAYLRCEAGDTFVGSPNHETLMQWAREVDALTAGRAALANAEPVKLTKDTP